MVVTELRISLSDLQARELERQAKHCGVRLEEYVLEAIVKSANIPRAEVKVLLPLSAGEGRGEGVSAANAVDLDVGGQRQLAALDPLTRLRRPLPQREAKKHLRKRSNGYPAGYFERVAAQWQGEPLEREPTLELETRDVFGHAVA